MIRIESEHRLDLLRATGMTRGSGGIPGLNRSGPFLGLNYSKRGVTLNLQTDRGKDLAKELVSRADIVTMNYAAGVAERLGLGYEDFKAIKPDIIMMFGSPLGQTGPEAHSTGWGPTTLAYTMLPHVTGYPGGTPSSMGGSYPDFVVGVHMAFAMMGALRHRDRTGHGQYIDVAMGETTVAMTPEPLLEWTMAGADQPMRGNRDPDRAPQGVYPCAGEDRWVAISVEDDEMWAGLQRALDDPEWARDPGLGTLEGRQVRHDDIDRELSAWTSSRSPQEAAALLQAEGVAATAVLDGFGLLDDPQLQYRGFFVDIDHPEVGVTASAGIPLRYSETQLHYGSTPLLGQHNREVFTDLVGLEPAEIDQLVDEQVIA